MTLIVHNDYEKEELENKIENCLNILYELEDLTNYNEQNISNCIDLLQDVTVKKECDL